MSAAWPIVVFAFCIGALTGARRGVSWVPTLAWLALAGGFAFLMWGDANLAAAVSVAAIAGVAVTPAPRNGADQFRAASFGAVAPVAVAFGALICVRDASSMWHGNVVLFAAAWAALVAAMASFIGAMGVAKRPLTASVPLTMVGAAVAIYVAGTGRSSLPNAFYGFRLRTGEETLQWVLAPVQGFESGMRLSVAVPVPTVEAALIALAVLGAVAGVALLLGRHKVARGAMGVGALGSFGLLAGLASIVSGLSMPASDPYAQEVKRRLLARGGNQVTDTGAFNSAGEITVAMADLAPEIVGLMTIGILGLFGAWALHKHDANAETVPPARELSRDQQLRGVAFLWVAWFVMLIIHNDLLGAPGMGSPGEWVFTGVCIAASGVVLMRWREPTTRLGEVLDELAGGLLASAVLLCAGLAWRFGALPGLSLGVFE